MVINLLYEALIKELASHREERKFPRYKFVSVRDAHTEVEGTG